MKKAEVELGAVYAAYLNLDVAAKINILGVQKNAPFCICKALERQERRPHPVGHLAPRRR